MSLIIVCGLFEWTYANGSSLMARFAFEWHITGEVGLLVQELQPWGQGFVEPGGIDMDMNEA